MSVEIPPSAESAPTVMGQTPPDQTGMSLSEHLDAALAIIGRDGDIAPDEQQLIMAFLQGIQGISRARQAAGRSPLGGPPPQQGQSPQSQEQPYMSHAGQEVPAYQ